MTQQSLTFVVLAGGMSSRFGGDKQIVEIDGIGRTIMELSILEARRAGATKLVLIVNDRVRPVIEDVIVPRLPAGLDVVLADQRMDQVPDQFQHLVSERKKIWGTGHALLAAADHVTGRMIVANADDFYGKSAYGQLAELLLQSDDWGMVGYPIAGTLSDEGSVNRGICDVEGEWLINVSETYGITRDASGIHGKDGNGDRRDIADDALASMAFWGFDDSIFERLQSGFAAFLETATEGTEEYVLTDEIEAALGEGFRKVRVSSAVDEWLGVTFKDDLAAVTGKLQVVYDGDDLAAD